MSAAGTEQQTKYCTACSSVRKKYYYMCPCKHSYCRQCLANMFRCALEDRTMMPVKCCNQEINQHLCREVLTKTTAAKYIQAWEEKRGVHLMFCPRKECSECIDRRTVPGADNRQVHCPKCNLQICLPCSAAHPGISCGQYLSMRSNENSYEDVEMHKFASRRHYARCPRCGRYVEHMGGCDHMNCWCGAQFSFSKHISPVVEPTWCGAFGVESCVVS